MIAKTDLNDLFFRNPGLGNIYKNRILCITLCQGAALHFINGKNGIKDFDVWTFFSEHEQRPFPYRRIVQKDFGDPKFGKSIDRSDFIGRRVDLIGRSIPYQFGMSPATALQNYLSESKNKSPRLLIKKAVIILDHEDLLGTVVWPFL